MKRKQAIKPINFKKYFMPTINQLVARTRNFHALVLLGTLAAYFGLYKLFKYLIDNNNYEPIGVKDTLIVLLVACFFLWLCIYLVSQAFDISLKLNYNAMEQVKKVPVFNFRHGWRSTLINSLYYLNTLLLGYLLFTIMSFVNKRTFDYSAAMPTNSYDYYYYDDKSELQQFFDSHSSTALVVALILLFLVSMVTAVFSGTNSQISYENKSGLESSIRALRRLTWKTWLGLTTLRFIYAFLVIAICYMGYMIYDYFGDFGQYAGPGIAFICFYFLYPYVVTLHTGYYYRYKEGIEEKA